MSDGIVIVPYKADHADFVLGTFRDSISACPPWSRSDVRAQRDVLSRVLRDPETRALVAVPRGHDDDLLGWAAGHAGSLIYAYVRHIVRRKGIGTRLLAALELGETPLSVVYWTRACSRLAAVGRPLFFDVTALERVTALVH